MISQPTSFYIPPEIEAGLLGGDFIRHGGIVRDQMGQIVKHLKEIPLPVSNEKAVARVAGMLKNPRVLIPTAILGTVAAGAAVIIAAKKRKQTGKPEVPECVQSYNASLAAYVEAVHEGRLELGIIERLIAELDAVKAHSGEEGSITLASQLLWEATRWKCGNSHATSPQPACCATSPAAGPARPRPE
ncbi:hypothetical protein ACPCSL_22140 [Streptomyces griseoincarnatus]